jgi:hypothetical protein
MLSTLALILMAAMPASAQQDARELLQTSVRMQAARESEVENYTVIQTIQLLPSPAYYEKENNGGHWLFRLVPMPEWQARRTGTLDMAEPMADAFDMISGPLGAQMTGVPGGAVFAQSMTMMMDSLSFYLRAIDDETLSDGRAEAADQRSDMALFAQRARLVGREDVDGKPAFHLRADDMSGIPLAQPEGGATFALSDVNLWLDVTEYVPVRLLMNGTMTVDGRTTPVTIELQQLDYQQTGPLYLPGRHLMRLSGMMEAMAADPEQREKLEEARRGAARMQGQMAEMEQQIAAIPSAAARRMVEGQMEKAMTQMDQLLSGGVVETEIAFEVFSINEGPPYDWKPGMFGG